MIALEDLIQATQGRIHHQGSATQFTSFAYDSRRLKPGQVFVAVQTTKADGHDYITEAITAGATGVLCQRPGEYPVTTVVVPHTPQALLEYARYILQKYRLPVIGVTGSVGKSTTKEAIAAVLASKYQVFKNFGSYNGRYGLPIALGDLSPEANIAVLEMACDSFGEIAELAQLTQPQVGVVTAVKPTHLAGLGSVENVALEKGRLVENLPPQGTAILNVDDALVAQMVQRTPAKTITYGFSQQANLRATDVTFDQNGTHFILNHQGQSYPLQTQLVGQHHVYAILAALAVGLVYHIPMGDGIEAIKAITPLPGRLRSLPGIAQSLILDDTFNASPSAVKAAVDTLAQIEASKRLAILGEMADLGQTAPELHADIGQYVAKKVDGLITYGEWGQKIAQAALKAGLSAKNVTITYTPQDAIQAVRGQLSADTAVLLKASASARLERVVAGLLANPADKRLLARYEPGWAQVQLGLPARPTWVETDLLALAQNTRYLANLTAPAHLMAVLKADAYGHGAVKVAHTVLSNGATWLAVATLGEGIHLRQAGLEAPILVLGYLPAWQASEAIRYDIRATVFTLPVLEAFSEAAQRLHKTANIHLKVDTGMGRLGLLPEQALAFIQQAGLPGVHIEGLFTHFARADEADLEPSHQQLQKFETLLAKLTALNLRPPLIHAANTAALLNLPQSHFDMVRTGIGLYGLNPAPETPLPSAMRPVLSFKTSIAQVKVLPSGSPLGYGATYHTQTEERIAVIPVGYADGFRRAPRTWQAVLVKGQRAPVVGRVSMDQATINVSHIPNLRQGDEVVLIGQQGQETITTEEVANWLGTINYEVISEILARVPRVS